MECGEDAIIDVHVGKDTIKDLHVGVRVIRLGVPHCIISTFGSNTNWQ